eukprot:2522297-Alexandrium_andersonii.AAC.1
MRPLAPEAPAGGSEGAVAPPERHLGAPRCSNFLTEGPVGGRGNKAYCHVHYFACLSGSAKCLQLSPLALPTLS